MYGGNLQNMISQQIKFVIPGWMNEGLAEYLSDGWSTNSDMWIRDLAINGGDLPEIFYLNGYMAYRGGQSVWRFIADKWGEESFSEIFYQIKKLNNVNRGFEKGLGELVELQSVGGALVLPDTAGKSSDGNPRDAGLPRRSVEWRRVYR